MFVYTCTDKKRRLRIGLMYVHTLRVSFVAKEDAEEHVFEWPLAPVIVQYILIVS